MPEEWNPNAPNINKDFQQARDNKQQEAQNNKQEQEQKQKVASKYELDALEQQRNKPNTSLEYTPNGSVARNADMEREALQREQRIKEIKESMEMAQERLRKGWDNSRGQ